MCWVCVSVVASVWQFVFCDCAILPELLQHAVNNAYGLL